jgi:hypothetical protein
MNYEELKESMPSASHVYYGVAQDVIESLTVSAWWGQDRGTYYMGTEEPVEELAALEVLPANS